MLCTLLHLQAEEEFKTGVLAPPEYIILRLVFFAAVLSAVLAVTAFTRKPGMLPVILAAGLTLPLIEDLTGYAFVYLNIIVIAFWLIRSVVHGLSHYKVIMSGLSAFSVKNAIDSMITGVMFCQKNGYVLLVNDQMQILMNVITGKTQRNGRHFYSLLTLDDIEPGCKTTWFEGQNVCLLPNGSAWMFSMAEMRINKRDYIQLTATDITERWTLATRLQPQNEELTRRQKELSEAIANLHIVSRERETQRAKIRAHDLLGERLTVLLRTARSEKEPDYPLLRSLSSELIDELKAVGNAPSPSDELDILRQTFKSIGVEIIIEGELPEDMDVGSLFADISREAVTNAVRHGLATQVIIHVQTQENGHLLRITDNGHAAAGTIKEGGGISGMRERLRPFGGMLRISAVERFTLTVTVRGTGG